MLILITMSERNKKTGRLEIIVSHGVDATTGQNVIVSCDTPERLGARFDQGYGEWVLDDPAEKQAATV